MPKLNSARWLLLSCLVASLPFACLGCTSAETMQAQAEQESNLKVIAILYSQFRAGNRGRPPQDEAAFKEFIQTKGSATLESFEKSSADELLISERDQQPYVIVYGQTTPPATADGLQVIAYEQQGVEGKILVANDLGDVREIEAAQLSK